MYKEKIINLVTGEETWRDYTAQEIAEADAAEAQAVIEHAERQAEQESKNAARAVILDRLGITAEEAALLLS